MASDSAFSYRHPGTGEWAHDVRNPEREAREMFVRPALTSRPPEVAGTLRILEFGFGRGTNTAVALDELLRADFTGTVEALGFEPNPEFLHPWPSMPSWGIWPWWEDLDSEWSWKAPNGARASGKIIRQTVQDGLATDSPQNAQDGFDWIFCDLFSPRRHPDDWSGGVANLLAKWANPGAVLTSYCVAHHLRDALSNAGWSVERLHSKGGRDSLRATFRLNRAAKA